MLVMKVRILMVFYEEKKTVLFPELIENRIKALSQSLSKFKIKDNLIVIRRFPKTQFNHKLKKGDSFLENGFLSTSINLFSRLDNESNYSPINNEILMLLKVPKETNACYIEKISNKGEYELLIQKGKRIKVEKNIKILNNRIVIGEITN
ncbi:MAG: ADP-ribosyltransferase [Winogradskyella sp.]